VVKIQAVFNVPAPKYHAADQHDTPPSL